MVVTLRALHRQSEPGCGSRRGTIDHALGSILFRINATLTVEEGLAMKSSGKVLFGRRVRDQVAGDLLDGELIEGLVAIKGIDHPLAPHPGVATSIVFFITIRVGVTSLIQPVACPALTEMGRCQVVVYDLLIGIW